MAGNDRALQLRGRGSECGTLDRLVTSARGGQSAVLVLHGEAGIGKSALLDYLYERAAGCRIARAVGAESEMELPFAGLHQLCLPFLEHLDQLPGPQSGALATAFGLSAGEPPDRFLVGLAVLSLLAEVATDQPLVCVIDDAQWLDRVSIQTLAFVARRLAAEPVAMVLAVRELDGLRELAGLPELAVRGLRDSDARTLLTSVVPGRLDERVRDRIVAETGGNPLALLELPRDMSAAELSGGFVRSDLRPVATKIEQAFLKRLQSLPTDAQTMLLVAAAEPVGDVELLRRATEWLEIGPDAATSAEDAGLIELGRRVRFRHPLVRSVAYRAGRTSDRQAAHRALAEATDPGADPDRRAWHRAQAAAGPDEPVAADLERSAARAQDRGGIAAAAAFLERATELSPGPAERAARALSAARTTFEAADLDAADDLLAIADDCPLSDLQSAVHARLRAQILFARRRGNDAPPLLLEAARLLEPLDESMAREVYLEALAAAIYSGRLGGAVSMRDVAAAARDLLKRSRPSRPIDLLLEGIAMVLTEGYAAGLPALRQALPPFCSEALRNRDEITRWLWLASPIAQEVAVHYLWDFETWDDLSGRAVQLARQVGALAFLPQSLVYRAGAQLHVGDFAAASASIEEADAITTATGYAPVTYASLVLMAWRGDETRARKLIDVEVKDATGRGEGAVIALAGYAKAVLYNGLGRHDAALSAAQEACSDDDLVFVGWSLPELIEAAARSGAHAEGAAALDQLDERTDPTDTEWAFGLRARSRALLSSGPSAEAHYIEAIERLERSRVAIHLARAHLLYGEWLRRENRRIDARQHLRSAHEMFTTMGAAAFADRARRELMATGETVRRRTIDAGDPLTSQEEQIARLARDGLTNSEIGAHLFISPHTVEWHLRKVFAKLGITSRRQLRSTFPVASGTHAAV